MCPRAVYRSTWGRRGIRGRGLGWGQTPVDRAGAPTNPAGRGQGRGYGNIINAEHGAGRSGAVQTNDLAIDVFTQVFQFLAVTVWRAFMCDHAVYQVRTQGKKTYALM